jgi:hypothetical protein
MKLFISCCLALVLILAGSPSQAFEWLELYDNFKGKSIDSDKWEPDGSSNVVRNSFDLVREVSGNSLRMLNRIYAGNNPSVRNSTSVRVRFPDPNVFTAVGIKGKVKELELIECAGNDRIRALRASGFFFNTIQPGGFGPFNAYGDVLASIYVERRGDSEDPPGVLRVIASVFLCGDPGCGNGSFLTDPPIDLGEYKVGSDIKLFMQWDEPNSQFIFQRDNEPEETYIYEPLLNQGAPSFPARLRLGLTHRVSSYCTVGPGEPQPMSFVETSIDEVLVDDPAP